MIHLKGVIFVGMFKVVLSWSNEEGRTFIIKGESSFVDKVVDADYELYDDLEVSEESFDSLVDAEKYFDSLKKDYPEADVTDSY